MLPEEDNPYERRSVAPLMPLVNELLPYVGGLLLVGQLINMPTQQSVNELGYNPVGAAGFASVALLLNGLSSRKVRNMASKIVSKVPYYIAEGANYLTAAGMAFEAHRLASKDNLENIVLELGILAGASVFTGLLFRRARQKSGIEF